MRPALAGLSCALLFLLAPLPTQADDSGFGLNLGAGLHYSPFTAELRYEWGMLTTDEQPFGGYVMNADRRNRSLAILVGYTF